MMDPRIDLLLTPANAPSRYPDLENLYETTNPGHIWRISKGKYDEYLLTTTVPDGQNHMAILFYDIPDGLAIDQYNRSHPYIKPPSSQLIVFKRRCVGVILHNTCRVTECCICLTRLTLFLVTR
jgi:hypothetical protein